MPGAPKQNKGRTGRQAGRPGRDRPGLGRFGLALALAVAVAVSAATWSRGKKITAYNRSRQTGALACEEDDLETAAHLQAAPPALDALQLLLLRRCKQ